jgi:hypothetical protein
LGTTNPTDKLHVHGNVQVDSTLKVNGTTLIKGDAIIERDLRVDSSFQVNGPTIVKDFKATGNAAFSGGNTFIGGNFSLPNIPKNDTIPSGSAYFLSVNDKGDVQASLIYAEAASQSLTMCDLANPNPEGEGSFYAQNPNWRSSKNKLVVPCTDVNVGIGTESPNTSLDVNGVTHTTGLNVSRVYSPKDAKVYISSISTNGSEKILLVENNQRQLLQLTNDGVLKVREVIVDLAYWPDYVFDKNYVLMPLNEVEKFIQLEGHLPKIPAAETLEEQGLNIAEMNKLMMEKIEELTLYMIQQQKTLEEQQQKIEKLEVLIGQ